MSVLDVTYQGPWPAYPGMYPCVLTDSGLLVTVVVWDKDVSREQLAEDIGRFSQGKLAVVNFGSADEIAEFIGKAQAEKRAVILDTSGTTAETQNDFTEAGRRRDLQMLTVKVG